MSALADLLARRFVLRDDAWVAQAPGRGHRARRGRLGAPQIGRHLAGAESLCAYALAPGGDGALCLWGAFDLDAHGEGARPEDLLPPAARLQRALADLVGPDAVLAEATGGLGLHVWALLGEPAPAGSVLALMDAALARAGLAPGPRADLGEGLALERYPRSAALEPGRVGTALRLPLGRHPRTGRRSRLLDAETGEILEPALVLGPGPSRPGRAELAALGGPGPARPPSARPGRHPAPDAWLAYRWAAARLGLAERAGGPPPSPARAGHPVRCLWPAAHAHGDRPPGSAYVIREGETQLYGCAVCGGAMDTIALVRRVAPGLGFVEALRLCHQIDPLRCPEPR